MHVFASRVDGTHATFILMTANIATMDSASPIVKRLAGQTTVNSGNTFTFTMRTFAKAEGFVIDWLGIQPLLEHREAHHPSATGYRPDA